MVPVLLHIYKLSLKGGVLSIPHPTPYKETIHQIPRPQARSTCHHSYLNSQSVGAGLDSRRPRLRAAPAGGIAGRAAWASVRHGVKVAVGPVTPARALQAACRGPARRGRVTTLPDSARAAARGAA